MDKIKVVEARLNIEMLVYCPNPECEQLIDLLREEHTDSYNHNAEGYLLRQMFPEHGDHADFKCNNVTCSRCKTTFNVKGLEW